MEILLTIMTSVVVPIMVAIISSNWFAKIATKKIDTSNICDKLDELNYKIDRNQAESKRAFVLRFNGEIKHGIHHDEEEFNECLSAIDYYEDYCRQHPNYPNSKAVMAIANVKRVYEKAYQKNDF
mgnify:CR=1 FL=1